MSLNLGIDVCSGPAPETRPLNEPILPDDYPICQGYFYVINGKPIEFIEGEGMTVGTLKTRGMRDFPTITEIRRCDMTGRIFRMPEKKVPENTIQRGWNEAGNHIHQRKRRSRSSNKIKKMK